MNSIGERVRKLRDERGLSQLALGKAIGVRQTTISQIENGENKPSWKTLQKLTEYFGVPLSYLLDEELQTV